MAVGIALVGLGVMGYVLLSPGSAYSLENAFTPLNTQANKTPDGTKIPKDTPPDAPIAPSRNGLEIKDAQLYVGGQSQIIVAIMRDEPLRVQSIAVGEEWVSMEEYLIRLGGSQQITLYNVTGTPGSVVLLQLNATTLSGEQLSAQLLTNLQEPMKKPDVIVPDPEPDPEPDPTRVYYYYVDPIPDYAEKYARDAVSEATKAWESKNPNLKFYAASSSEKADFYIKWVRDYGQQHVGWAHEELLQIGLGDSKCKDQWTPFSAMSVRQIVMHEIGHFLGFEHSPDVNNIMYISTKVTYGEISEDMTSTANYYHMKGLCSRQAITSYTFEVSTTSSTGGFDVYSVPSKKSFDDALDGKSFSYYMEKGCFAIGQTSFKGACKGVSYEGGLLIINHQKSTSLETISVKITHTDHENNYEIPLISQVKNQ